MLMKIKRVDIDEYRKVVTDDMPDIQISNFYMAAPG